MARRPIVHRTEPVRVLHNLAPVNLGDVSEVAPMIQLLEHAINLRSAQVCGFDCRVRLHLHGSNI